MEPAPARLPTTWKTKDGMVIKIRDLDDGHLANIIQLLYKKGKIDTPRFKALTEEKERRLVLQRLQHQVK